ncbi:MAG: ATP-binding protein [Acidimicrobiales bacterium]
MGTSSPMIASQVPVGALHQSFEDATVADAVLDRIVHSSRRIEMKGEYIRKLHAPPKEAEWSKNHDKATTHSVIMKLESLQTTSSRATIKK